MCEHCVELGKELLKAKKELERYKAYAEFHFSWCTDEGYTHEASKLNDEYTKEFEEAER
jgi:hypothetical protein